MEKLREFGKQMTEIFWRGAAWIIKPLMELADLIPGVSKSQGWWDLHERLGAYGAWGWKKATLFVSVVLTALFLWAFQPVGGWRVWWEWQTFSGAKEDPLTPSPSASNQSTATQQQSQGGIYISGVEQIRYYPDEKDRKPRPVALNFPASVAPLTNVGREAEGIEMSPPLAGKWTWVSPSRLEFLPEKEWPIGETYKITLGGNTLAPHANLQTNTVTISTPRFDVRLRNATFYQDPEQVTLRKAVFDVNFNYPVDPESFEKNIHLVADSQVPGFLNKLIGGSKDDSRKFTVTYDNEKLNASIHSEPLSIPEKTTSLTLVIDKGAASPLGGNAVDHEVRQAVSIPGLYNLELVQLRHMIVTGENGDPENVLQIDTSMSVRESEMGSAVSAWLLPAKHTPKDSDSETTAWNSLDDVTDDVLSQATAVQFTAIPSEREAYESHSFKFDAEPGRYLYVRIKKGLSSVGGYQLGNDRNEIVRVKQAAPELTIMSKGSLLAMSGEKKLPIVVRDLPGIHVEIARLLPQQLQHLVTHSQGDMSKPEFYYGITPDDLTERFEKTIPLNLVRGKTHYEAIDFSEYMRADTSDRRGVFLLTVSGADPNSAASQTGEYQQPYRRSRSYSEDEYEGDGGGEDGEEYQPPSEYIPPSSMRDSRMVIVTDLGMISKQALDGTRDVFVQSISTGQPVHDATVEIWARNGTVLVSGRTDAAGLAHLPSVNGLLREKAPVVIVVRREGDLSFLPLNRYGRNLEISRFDVGGVRSTSLPNQIQAYLFSDRGIYRPGDTINVGVVAKSSNWAQNLVDMPVEVEVIDARGLVVRRDKMKLGIGGMAEFSHATQDSSPTGNYTINLNLARDSGSALPGAQSTPALRLGSTTVKVQEFMPDRMKVSATLSRESTEGWVSPADLKARVNVLNLFGTPATNRRVEAVLTLSPAYPAFRSYPQYSFTDPSRAKETFSDKLGEKQTDEQGIAEFDLGLQRYQQATYHLHFLANAFEPEGGRNVSAEAATLVSDRPYLVGHKADGDLGYIDLNTARHVSFIAIDPKAKKTAVGDLHLVRVERKVVSVLVKQPNGLLKYESRPLESVIRDEPFNIPAAGASVALPTQTPGNFAYVLRDATGLELSRVNYSVAGVGNVSRSLDRNAELQMTLDRKDYTPGDEIEISIRAPYSGAGLITIERDKVYAHKWFKTSNTSSVQKITLPRDFEGNGYVSVQFTRDLASNEIYMSPMSYGVMPFATSLSRRTLPISLDVPALVKPGQTVKLKLESRAPARAIVFAVDEGILQVARYQSPDPLSFFFQKRALEVNTQHTLDLILPEFRRLMQAAAPGGDADGQVGKHLNPFKRRTDKPVAYWSGIINVDGNQELSYTVPESFNGSLRVMAVAVSDNAVASATASTTVRGDIVLLPNVPVAITPGDEVEIGIGVSNNAKGSGKDAQVALAMSVSPALEIVGPATQNLSISERTEGTTKFRVKAKSGSLAQLGSASITFTASVKDAKAKLTTDVSVRPASAYTTLVQTGMFRGDATLESQARMYPAFKRSDAALSGSPWAFASGLIRYLDVYPHGCTEQITSQTFPAVVLSTQPAISEQLLRLDQTAAPGARKPDPNKSFERYLTQVRARQAGDGGISMWPGGPSDLFATTYVVSLLVEAKDRRFAVPNDMLQRANVWLQTRLAEVSPQDYNWRVQAQAAYLLTRQGVVVTAALNNLSENLRSRIASAGSENQRQSLRIDLGAVYLAASFQILKQDKIAFELLLPSLKEITANTDPWRNWYWYYYYDPLVRNATVVQLIALHFPEQIKQLPMDFWNRMASAIKENYYQSLSAARILLAVDAYAIAASKSAAGKVQASAIDSTGAIKAVELPKQLILTAFALPPDTAKLKLYSGGDLPLFYSWAESGYEIDQPDAAISKGLEIVHDILNDKGEVVTEARVGEELTVRVRVRALDRSVIQQVALVDILPGAMEPVLSAPSDSDEPDFPIWRRRLGGKSTWEIDYADIREDRVIFYGNVDSSMTEVTYKVRATNVGEFVVPAAYGEAMYERRVFGRSLGGKFKINAAN